MSRVCQITKVDRARMVYRSERVGWGSGAPEQKLRVPLRPGSQRALASAFGGVLFGVLADRIGRARALVYAILIYSGFTGLTATATGVATLLVWRTLVGTGMGGVWSAGSVLVAESWPAEHRGKAAGLMQSGWAIGYILAALLAAALMPRWGWRPLFVVGVAPAL